MTTSIRSPLSAVFFCLLTLLLCAAGPLWRAEAGGPARQGVAMAGGPGEWTRVTDVTSSNLREVALARTADGYLHVVWVQEFKDPASGYTRHNLVHSIMDPNGRVQGEPDPIVADINSISNAGVVVTPDGGLRVFFGALDPQRREFQGNVYTATGDVTGADWAFEPRPVSRSSNAGTSQAIAATVASDGTFFTAFGSSYHRGLDGREDDTSFQRACCAYHPALATDAESGEVVLAWSSNASKEYGLFTQSLAPAPGEKVYVPGSAREDRNAAIAPSQQMALTARRSAGGVYTAYCTGYPTCDGITLWRHGGGEPLVVSANPGGNVQAVNVAAGPEGRLWVLWRNREQFFFTRSNKALTRFGPVVSVSPPAGTGMMYHLKGEGSVWPLDAFATFQNQGELATWHTQVLPTLSLDVNPRVFTGADGATVTFTVTDAGDPVEGATLEVGGKSATTDAQGRASLAFPKGTSAGRLAVKASMKGYNDASAHITAR